MHQLFQEDLQVPLILYFYVLSRKHLGPDEHSRGIHIHDVNFVNTIFNYL